MTYNKPMFNYSFWADEAYISGIAAQLAVNKVTFLQALSFPGITYQRLHMLVVALFFKVFGVSELAARLPSILGLIFGIVVIFLLAKRLSNVYGGIISAFLYAFSNLNLAYTFQAKPYITIEGITLLIIYLLIGKQKLRHLFVIALCTIATLLHSIGIFLWVLYSVYFLMDIKKLKAIKSNGLKLSGIIVLIIGFLAILPVVYSFIRNGSFFQYNHLYQSIKLFTYKYPLILIGSAIGYLWLFRKYKNVSLSIAAYGVVVFCMASFEIYIFNIRYVLALFGILFLYFGVFWAKVGERYDSNFKFKIYNFKVTGKAIIPLAVIILLYATGYKIVRWPQAYYSPNIDKYGDIQIANYKDFYGKLKARFPEYKKLYVINDTFDVEYWYFGRYSNAYFMKGTTKPTPHSVVKKALIFGSLEDFKKQIKVHPQGILIMEDWQSFLPDDIKEYAKKNLRLEYRVESLNEAPDDPWPLALYSWGMN